MLKTMINEKNKCCGCGVCSLVCRKGAIRSGIDEKGFSKYGIHTESCIDCNACSSVCPMNESVRNEETKDFFLYKTREEDVYFKSSSGGVFDAAARFIFDKGKAVCFGVNFNDKMQPVYSHVDSYEQIDRFRGSKYISVENDPEVFNQVRDFLLNGYYVLFTGSPCYVSALVNYLKRTGVNSEKLYTVDFICHGAGDPAFWQKHISMIQRKTNKTVVDYRFRHKLTDHGHSFHTEVVFSDGSKCIDKPFTKIYDNLYFKNVLMRESCYSCDFAGKARVSDLSMGDNKGYVYSDQDEVDFKNSSLVLMNNSKGKEMMEFFGRTGYIKQIDVSTLIQPHLSAPVSKPPYYDKFWKEYRRFGYFFLAAKYASYNPISIYRLKKSGYLKTESTTK